MFLGHMVQGFGKK